MRITRTWNLFILGMLIPIFIFDGYIFYIASIYYGYKRDVIMYITLDALYNFIMLFVVCLSTRKISQLKTDQEDGSLIPKNKINSAVDDILIFNIINLILITISMIVYLIVFIYSLLMLCGSGSMLIDNFPTSCKDVLYIIGSYILYHVLIALFSIGSIISIRNVKITRQKNSTSYLQY